MFFAGIKDERLKIKDERLKMKRRCLMFTREEILEMLLDELERQKEGYLTERQFDAMLKMAAFIQNKAFEQGWKAVKRKRELRYL